MAIDWLSEQQITAKVATRYFLRWRDDKPTHVSRVIRAMTKGSPTPAGGRADLEAARVNGQWITTVEAVQRYLDRLSPQRPDADTRRSPAERTRASEHAERELTSLGI